MTNIAIFIEKISEMKNTVSYSQKLLNGERAIVDKIKELSSFSR